jgi:hypothetical protein
MTVHLSKPCAAFEGTRLLLSGPLIEVALAVKTASDRGTSESILTFDDATGRVVDFDLRGSKADVVERLARSSTEPSSLTNPRRADVPPRSRVAASSEEPKEIRGRGRPRLGVIGREVTLLPRHWEWLAAQPGGASVALRRLVDEARRNGAPVQAMRAAQERAYHFMSAMAGDLPGFEEATRALFANNRARFEQQVASWPGDVSAYAIRLAYAEQSDAALGTKEQEGDDD